MADIEKARMALDYLSHALLSGEPTRTLSERIDDVRRALDGDGAEEWEAREDAPGYWSVWRTVNGNSTLVIGNIHKAQAHRVARLPALERAAEALLRSFEGNMGGTTTQQMYAIDDLRAALKQGGG